MILLAVHLYALLAIQKHVPKPARAKSDGVFARGFVDNFYAWQTTLASKPVDEEYLALTLHRERFSNALWRALKDDWLAESKSNLLVGLDFDPFFNSQVTPTHYRVGKVEPKGQNWLVHVTCTYAGTSATSSATAEVAKIEGKWRLANLRYDREDNLLGILGALEKEREKAKPEPDPNYTQIRTGSAGAILDALKAGKADTYDYPVTAKNFGTLLKEEGAVEVHAAPYAPELGDFVVIAGSPSHPLGHVEVYDGKSWMSDFEQKDLMPYLSALPYKIYRFPRNLRGK